MGPGQTLIVWGLLMETLRLAPVGLGGPQGQAPMVPMAPTGKNFTLAVYILGVIIASIFLCVL